MWQPNSGLVGRTGPRARRVNATPQGCGKVQGLLESYESGVAQGSALSTSAAGKLETGQGPAGFRKENLCPPRSKGNVSGCRSRFASLPYAWTSTAAES